MLPAATPTRHGHAAVGAIISSMEPYLPARLLVFLSRESIPPKTTEYLDQLKTALEHAMEVGVDAEFLIEGITEQLEERPEAMPEEKPERVRMVSDTKYKKAKAELAEANKKIQKLNEENNSLTLYVRKLEAQRAQSGD
ncbi:hypothetical protein B5807_01815 [Epicoccum nigrum]|uniref:Uncharacterized protein n=1 Tax=Epicoccum nigrum TaxID=105696 RepID=A0A1Y2MG22_EPING|nr:hypothetical protein B5807_01815 [Epicoccum nigrum]